MPMFFTTILLSGLLFFGGCTKPAQEEVLPEPPPEEKPKPPAGYKPGNGSDIQKDYVVSVDSAFASEHQSGSEISKALDGNYTSLYHSLWNKSKFPGVPVVIEFFFASGAGTIDYMLYHPRKDGGDNGHILEAAVWIRSQDQQAYSKVSDLVFANTAVSKRISFEGFDTPAAIKLVITKGNNDFVSASQFGFFKRNNQVEAFEEYFTDLSFSALKSGVTRPQLEAIDNSFIRTMALAIFDDIYEKERVGTYITYPDPAVASALNKTNRMGSYDNMTGIHVKWGEELVVFVDETQADMYLRIVNHYDGYGGQDFYLSAGANRITSPSNGLVYLIYNSPMDHESTVNIATGTINGYFDISRHTHADWQELIAAASYGFFDLKGEKAHLTFTTAELRQHVTNATRLLEVYDSIVTLEQQIMGLYKYGRVPKGRLYYRTNTKPGVYMHATGNATEYAPGTLEQIANHQLLRTSAIWGPAHETGHIHQTRPGLMWVGLTEVTVNIYSQHVQTNFGNASRLQTEKLSGYTNRYEKAFSQIIAPGSAHGAHEDVFCKLVPFWQLQLYYAKALDREDFYMDVHEMIRQNPNAPNDGMSQLEFIKVVCDVAGEDLTDFFRAWGYLTPIDQDINDYGTKRLTITEQQIQEVESIIQAKGYSKPRGIIQYITDATVDIYRKNANIVAGTATRTGNEFQMTGWQNVAAFEIYSQNRMLFATAENKFNVGSLPVDFELYAVSVKGIRQRVSL